MNEKVRKLVRALFKDKSLVFAGFLLLAVVFLDFLFLYPTVPELDIFEHFLFGFVLSQFSSRTANSMALDELVSRRLEQKNPRRVDLLIRLIGFFLIGGLLWEASERFVFPLFGYVPDRFFSFPITLTNIDWDA